MHTSLASLLVLALSAASTAPAAAGDGNWPSFHGPRGSGVGSGTAPLTWNLERGENVRWKTPIPGLAHASPVVWGDRVYVVTAVGGQEAPELRVGLYGDIGAADDDGRHQWQLYALERSSGEVAWTRTLYQGTPAIRRHTKATHANSTPATDGRHVVVFLGSEGLFCFDRDGGLKWKKTFGTLDAGYYMMPPMQWGFGNSPVIHDGKVIVLADVQKGGFLAVYDLADGRELWRVARDEVPTWSSPAVIEHGEATQVAVNGFKHIGAYDFATGAEVWKMKGGGDIPVPTPVAGHGLVFITNAHGRMSPVYAVKTSARGDITLEDDQTRNDHIAWAELRGGAYMQTPILYGDQLYVCRDNGVLTCYDARSGEQHYRERLTERGDGFTASGVAVDGKLYYTAETGDVYVVKAGTAFELLATNALGELTLATPAISDGLLLFRTRGHLIAIGETPAAAAAGR